MKLQRSFTVPALLILLATLATACQRRLSRGVPTDLAQWPPPTAAHTTLAPTDTPPPGPMSATDRPSSPSPSATPTPRRARSDPSLPRSRYQLSADFDYNRHQLTVFETLTFVNRSEEVLTELLLMVEPNRHPGAFQLDEITWSDGSPVEGFALEGSRLTISLPTALHPWEAVEVQLSFRLELPPAAGPFGYSDRQANLGDWYPLVPLYQAGRGWLVFEPGEEGVGEYQTYEIADYEVQIQLLDPPPNLTLAGSAPDLAEGNWHFFQRQAARNFTFSASQEYETLTDERGFVRVVSYAFPEHRAASQAALEATAAALELYAELFGPLTQPSLTVVEAEFPDGREYDGLYFLGRGYYETFFGGPQNFLTTLAAHETCHQWWYGRVANDQAHEPWLDEALSTYCEKLFFERYYPDLVEWWWEFRVDLYAPTGQVDTSIYDYEGFRPYVNAVYLRGASFLEALRELVGDEAFFGTLMDYGTRRSLSQGTTADFFMFMDRQTQVDYTPLLDEFFRARPEPEAGR